jgi:hypothetical protein
MQNQQDNDFYSRFMHFAMAATPKQLTNSGEQS